MGDKPLTGRHVLAITLGAFGVVIFANLALVFAAVGSFPGLEVKNSYVASQQFEARRAAQEALGWEAGVDYGDGLLMLRLQDRDVLRADARGVVGMAGRATHTRDDRELVFIPAPHGWQAEVDLPYGRWHINFTATARDGTAFSQQLSLWIPEEE